MGNVIHSSHRDPLVPRHGTDVVLAVNLQGGRDVRCHLAKRVGGRANVNRLPVAIEHQHYRLIQYVGHKIRCEGVYSLLVLAHGGGKLAASPGFAPGPPVSETGALLIMRRGKGRLRNLQKRKTRGDSYCDFQDTSASGLSTQNTK